MSATRTVRRSGQRITYTPTPETSAADVAADLGRFAEFGARMALAGASMRMFTQRLGSRNVALYVTKNVGPPAWRTPKLTASVFRTGAELGCGWRMTAYTAGVVIIRRRAFPEGAAR